MCRSTILLLVGLSLSFSLSLVGCSPAPVDPADHSAFSATPLRRTPDQTATTELAAAEGTDKSPVLDTLETQLQSISTADTLVVCRSHWKSLMQDWIEYRTQQGHQIDWMDVPESAHALKSNLKQRFAVGLKYVLLVGDIPSAGNGIADGTGISTGVVDCEVSHRFGGPDLVATDNWYVDFDGDHAPELAIGRWAIDSAEELTGVIEKTIRFETDPDIEFAKRRIEFVAGVGGFGFLEDKVIETTASRLLTDLLPGHHEVNMTHASWRSVYCPGPDLYQSKIFESLNRGSLFWVYMGHGSPASLDNAEFPDRRVATINIKNTDRLQSKFPSIALMLACSTGEFAGPRDCLAESMVAAPHGPVAALAGTGVTAPFGLASFGFEMLTLYRHEKPKVLGDWLVKAKQTMIHGDSTVTADEAAHSPSDQRSGWRFSNADYRRLLRQLAGLFSPTSDMLEQELAEHCEMMTLFGDPLLRLPQYDEIQLEANTRSDGTVEISGRMPNLKSTEVQLEIVHPLDRLSFRPIPRNEYDRSAEFHQQFEETYSKANNRVIQKAATTSLSGKFSITLAQLGHLPHRVLVRAFINEKTCQALGFCEVKNQTETEPTTVPGAVEPQEEVAKPEEPKQDDSETAEKTDPLAQLISADDEFQMDGKPIVLYDRKTLEGWKLTNFGGEREVYVRDDGDLEIETGYPMTGITFKGTANLKVEQFPKENYELQLRVQKVEGGDFFAGVTFPVGQEPCSFIAGGWGGTTVGLSSIDGKDAARNETRSVHRFEAGKWFILRIRVTENSVQCWIDKEQVVDQKREGHEFSVRNEVRLSMPLGFCNFQTNSRISHFQLVKLKPSPAPEKDSNQK